MRKAIDRWGHEIELTDERWAHITYWHPDLENHMEEVLKVIKKGQRRQDPLDPKKYRYILRTDVLMPEYNHIVAIVKLVRNNFIVTAYPIFKEERRER